MPTLTTMITVLLEFCHILMYTYEKTNKEKIMENTTNNSKNSNDNLLITEKKSKRHFWGSYNPPKKDPKKLKP